MLFAVRQFATDTDDKHGTIFLADSILALLRCLVRIELQQVLCMDKSNLLWQERLQLRISLTGEILRAADGSINTLHHILQISHRTLLACDDGLPVPLVHIQRVQIVQLLVSTNSIHVRIDAIARLYLVFGQ